MSWEVTGELSVRGNGLILKFCIPQITSQLPQNKIKQISGQLQVCVGLLRIWKRSTVAVVSTNS